MSHLDEGGGRLSSADLSGYVGIDTGVSHREASNPHIITPGANPVWAEKLELQGAVIGAIVRALTPGEVDTPQELDRIRLDKVSALFLLPKGEGGFAEIFGDMCCGLDTEDDVKDLDKRELVQFQVAGPAAKENKNALKPSVRLHLAKLSTPDQKADYVLGKMGFDGAADFVKQAREILDPAMESADREYRRQVVHVEVERGLDAA